MDIDVPKVKRPPEGDDISMHRCGDHETDLAATPRAATRWSQRSKNLWESIPAV